MVYTVHNDDCVRKDDDVFGQTSRGFSLIFASVHSHVGHLFALAVLSKHREFSEDWWQSDAIASASHPSILRRGVAFIYLLRPVTGVRPTSLTSATTYSQSV